MRWGLAAIGIVLASACGRAPNVVPVPVRTAPGADPPSVIDAGTVEAPPDAAVEGGSAVADYVPPPTDCSRGALVPGTVVIEERTHSRSAEAGGGDEKVVIRKEIRGAAGEISVRVSLVSSQNVEERVIVSKVLRSYMDLTPCKRDGEPMCPGTRFGLSLMDGFDGESHETALMPVDSSAAFQPIVFEHAKFFREAAQPRLEPGTRMPSFKEVALLLTDFEPNAGSVSTSFVEERKEPWGAMRVFRTTVSLKESVAAMYQSAIIQTNGTITTLVRAADGAPIEIDIQTTNRSTPTRVKGPTEVTKSRFKISRPCFRTAFKA